MFVIVNVGVVFWGFGYVVVVIVGADYDFLGFAVWGRRVFFAFFFRGRSFVLVVF